MTDRITRANLETRAANVNRRISSTGRTVQVQGRNGYTGLDEYGPAGMIRTLTVGTKREVADFLHAMMVGIDLSRGETFVPAYTRANARPVDAADYDAGAAS